MMRAVAYVAVEIAGWFGVGAYQLGNVIQLRNGFVGVDEACSGVKTLQAGIMVALVLGEFLQLRWNKRIALLVVGCGWVFVCNVFRATVLVFVAANSGLEALGRWHDWIGTAALLCGMAGMLGLAWLWKGGPKNILESAAGTFVAQNFPSQRLALRRAATLFCRDPKPARRPGDGRFSFLRIRAERPAAFCFRLHPGRQARRLGSGGRRRMEFARSLARGARWKTKSRSTLARNRHPGPGRFLAGERSALENGGGNSAAGKTYWLTTGNIRAWTSSGGLLNPVKLMADAMANL